MNRVNGIRAISIRLTLPWVGAWHVEADLDLEDDATVPSGAATVVIGGATLVGTIDPRASGRFGARAGVRIVGGAGAWDTTVKRRDYRNDAGVTARAVVSSTAAEVGERAGTVPDDVLGDHYVRLDGPASQVFGARAWHVTLDGLTNVGERTQGAAPADLDVLSYRPENGTAEIGHDEIVMPGWTITDTRFGTVIIRDVEQVFSAEGARATAWCSPAPTTRLASVLTSMIHGMGGLGHLRSYEYRVFGMAGDRAELQSVRAGSGAPDLAPSSIWFGLPGTRAELAPGSRVLVEFVEGDPARPLVRAFEPSDAPVSLHMDAGKIVVGAGSEPVGLGESTVKAVETLQKEIVAINKAVQAIAERVPTLEDPDKAKVKAADLEVLAGDTTISSASATIPSKKLSSE